MSYPTVLREKSEAPATFGGTRPVWLMRSPATVGTVTRGLLAQQALTEEPLVQMVAALITAAGDVDRSIIGHSFRVSQLSVALGYEMDLPPVLLAQLRLGGLLHDVGKMEIGRETLLKPGPLSPAEFAQVKRHPALGAEMLARFPETRAAGVIDVVRHHHERLDGLGYPDGQNGMAITLQARVVAVCDVYDALANHRPYHVALPPAEAVALLEAEGARGRLDQHVIARLRRLVLGKCRGVAAAFERMV